MTTTYISRIDVLELVTGHIEDVRVVLDLGAGIQPQPFVTSAAVHICVDAHRPYLERLQRERAGDPRYVLVNATWDQFVPLLPDKSVDTVFALDFIEHLEKQDGLRMLREAERVARRQVVVHTPLGFFPQSYEDPQKPDRWGMDGGRWQTHRSGWEVEDFGGRWDFVVCPDYILLDENNETMARPMGSIWAILTLDPEGGRRHLVMKNPSPWTPLRKLLKRTLPVVLYDRILTAWEALHRPARK